MQKQIKDLTSEIAQMRSKNKQNKQIQYPTTLTDGMELRASSLTRDEKSDIQKPDATKNETN